MVLQAHYAAHFADFPVLRCSRTSMYIALRCSEEPPNCTHAAGLLAKGAC